MIFFLFFSRTIFKTQLTIKVKSAVHSIFLLFLCRSLRQDYWNIIHWKLGEPQVLQNARLAWCREMCRRRTQHLWKPHHFLLNMSSIQRQKLLLYHTANKLLLVTLRLMFSKLWMVANSTLLCVCVCARAHLLFTMLLYKLGNKDLL